MPSCSKPDPHLPRTGDPYLDVGKLQALGQALQTRQAQLRHSRPIQARHWLKQETCGSCNRATPPVLHAEITGLATAAACALSTGAWSRCTPLQLPPRYPPALKIGKVTTRLLRRAD